MVPLRICLTLLAPFAASCGMGDKAQLPRSLATPFTVAGAVFDLEHADQAALEPWMDALDPQGHALVETDDFQWRLQNLRQTGVKRVLALGNLQADQNLEWALLLHCKEGSDPLPMLEAFWQCSFASGRNFDADQLTLAQWQEGWWLVEYPGLWQPEIQIEEHGAPLQAALSKNSKAPIRIGLAIGDEPKAQVAQAIGQNPMAFWLLGPSARSLISLRGGYLTLDHSRSRPRVLMQLDFESSEYAENFAEAAGKALASVGDFARGIATLGMALSEQQGSDPEMSQLAIQAVQKGFEQIRFEPVGPACHLHLGRAFFDSVRHLRNLQTQRTDTVALR